MLQRPVGVGTSKKDGWRAGGSAGGSRAGGHAGRLLGLQRTAGNAAVSLLLQREWDPDLVKTNPAYSQLPFKMKEILPHKRDARLAKFAKATHSPEQLIQLLALADADKLEPLLPMGSQNLGALAKLASDGAEFQKLAYGCLRHRIHAHAAVLAAPEMKAGDLQAQIDAAQRAADEAAGLISGNGDKIDWQPAASIVGDGKADERAAVAAALAGLDDGTLRARYHGNGEGNLPGIKGGGGYREYDVRPPPGTRDAGRRRLVVSIAKGFVYYTWNHYGNDGTTLPAFKRIR